MTRVDLHVKVLNQSVINRAKAAELDVLVYAPHFTQLHDIQATAEAYTSDDLQIIPAREIFTGPWWKRRHILAIGLTEPVPDFIPLDCAIHEVTRQDAALLIPHPEFLSVSLAQSDIETYAEYIDAVETYNPKLLPHHNKRAERLAETLTLQPFGSSYAHLSQTVGEVWTEVAREIATTEDLRDAIIDQQLHSIGYNQHITHHVKRAVEVGHLGWENTWHKFKRVVLEGEEETHPANPCYPDHFLREMDTYSSR